MKTRLFLVTIFFAFMLSAKAQSKDSTVNKDVVFNDHVIRLYQLKGNGYGYDIFYKNSLIVHQNNNPFTNAPEGLKNKEDAIKTAKWQIIHLNLKPINRQVIIKKQPIPIEVSKQLNITIN